MLGSIAKQSAFAEQTHAWTNKGPAVGANQDSPLQQSVLNVSAKAQWKETMKSCADLLTYDDAAFYYDALDCLDIWGTTY